MSAALSTIVKNSGDFITRVASGGTIAIGTTGATILTPPAGQRVRLTHLSTTAGANQVGISVALGSDVVVAELDLDGDSPNTTLKFSVGSYQAYGAAAPPRANYSQFTGKTDEALTITKNAGNTVSTVYYGYEFGL